MNNLFGAEIYKACQPKAFTGFGRDGQGEGGSVSASVVVVVHSLWHFPIKETSHHGAVTLPNRMNK